MLLEFFNVFPNFTVSPIIATVAIILIASVVAPRWSEQKLVKLRVWLLANSRMILIVVFGAMGLLFTIQGVTALLK